jgi:hypothetical protein
MSADLDTLIAEIRIFVAEREWAQFHDPKNLSMAVASEAGELLAEYRWVGNNEADAVSQDPAARARIAAEIADVGISLLMLSDRIGLDLVGAMRAKLAQNALKYPVEKSKGRSDRP